MKHEVLYDYCPRCEDIMEYDHDRDQSYCVHCDITIAEPEAECTCYMHPNGGWVYDPECEAHGKHWSEMTIPERKALFGA